ncbi:ribosomal protein S21 [Neorhizobium galegae]|nr:ribosomal protein S21 [Neorhizobium galegae]MDQ0136288.1 ribosomal protein S21 [Neorhizobium galegae]
MPEAAAPGQVLAKPAPITIGSLAFGSAGIPIIDRDRLSHLHLPQKTAELAQSTLMRLDFAHLFCYLPSSIARLQAERTLFFRLESYRSRRATNQRNGIHVQVLVRDNNVDQALRALKKKMQREGIFREMKMRDYYEKPSQKRAREKAEAVRRVRKLARKRMQREGLIAAPARTVPARPAR